MTPATLVVDAANIVLRNLERIPDRPEVLALRSRALECIKVAEGWGARRPTVEEREKLMKDVLDLHTATRRLARTRRP
jgi:hypothetical protein